MERMNKWNPVLMFMAGAWIGCSTAPALAANPAEGAQIYATHCSQCHGQDGRGTVARAPDFTRGEKLLAPDAMLVRDLRRGGRGMPAYEGLLREQQLLDVMAYVRSFQR